MTTDQPTKLKRKRLTPKQRKFLQYVYGSKMSVNDALDRLFIRPGTFERWLADPVFMERLSIYIKQYYLEARLELARSVPRAVSGLATLSNVRGPNHNQLRQACNDTLNFYRQMAKVVGSKQAQNGAVLDNYGALLEQFGASLDNDGNVLNTFGNTNTTQNPILDTKKTENPQKSFP